MTRQPEGLQTQETLSFSSVQTARDLYSTDYRHHSTWESASPSVSKLLKARGMTEEE